MPAAPHRPAPALRWLRKSDYVVADWKCPLCQYGVPKGTLAASSKSKLRSVRQAHRIAKHPDVTVEAFSKLCRTRGAREERSVMRRRVAVLNRSCAKRLRGGDDCGTCVPFMQPRLRAIKQPNGAPERRLALVRFFRCQLRTRVLPSARKARAHHCMQLAAHVIKGRLKGLRAVEKAAPKLRHGIAPATLSQILADARRFLGGEPVEP